MEGCAFTECRIGTTWTKCDRNEIISLWNPQNLGDANSWLFSHGDPFVLPTNTSHCLSQHRSCSPLMSSVKTISRLYNSLLSNFIRTNTTSECVLSHHILCKYLNVTYLTFRHLWNNQRSHFHIDFTYESISRLYQLIFIQNVCQPMASFGHLNGTTIAQHVHS